MSKTSSELGSETESESELSSKSQSQSDSDETSDEEVESENLNLPPRHAFTPIDNQNVRASISQPVLLNYTSKFC